MKKAFLKYQYLIKRSVTKVFNKTHPNSKFNSLSPKVLDSKNVETYIDALKWAIDNKEEQDIKNIAITGQYGSGKSSVLKTLKASEISYYNKIMNISLANFHNTYLTELQKENNPKFLNAIESSILEQIIYVDKVKKLPDSRIDRIREYSFSFRIFITISILLYLISTLLVVHPAWISKIFNDQYIWKSTKDLIHYIKYSILFIGTGYFIFKAFRLISKTTFNKLKLKGVELGLNNDKDSSLLNQYIDEILYFFKKRKYNIVIFEDIDRYDETMIFTKLREVNLIINSHNPKKQVIFIYAIKDEMFKEKYERTKFFDFIVPIIPVINSSNSISVLSNINDDHFYQLSQGLIENISYFIQDMRLLNNIINEFIVYSSNLDPDLDPDRLFTMITYKNLNPEDFSKLGRNEGEMYNILINRKTELIKDKLTIINEKIESLARERITLKELNVKSLLDLQAIYVMKSLEQESDFKSYIHDGSEVSLSVLISEHFDSFTQGEILVDRLIHSYSNSYNIKRDNVSLAFSEVEKLVDKNKGFNEKSKEIKALENSRLIHIQDEIEDLQIEKDKLKILPISKLYNNSEKDLTEYELFVQVIIQNEYINESYINYISFFYEGSITQSDYKFEMYYRNQRELPWDYSLVKIPNLIKKFAPLDFKSEFIFNFQLIDAIIQDNINYSAQLSYFFQKLSDSSEQSLNFLKFYFAASKNKILFINLLCEQWENIWRDIVGNNLAGTEFDWLYKFLIRNLEIERLFKVMDNTTLTDKVIQDDRFLSIMDNQEKIISIISEYDLWIKNIDFKSSPDELLKFIFERGYYEINNNNVNGFISIYGTIDDDKLKHQNYEAILNSNLTELITHVNDNLDEYYINLYSQIDENKETQTYLLKLINSSSLSEEYKFDILDNTHVKFDQLKEFKDIKIYSKLFILDKIKPSWENVFFSLERNDKGDIDNIPVHLIIFFNVEENSMLLSKESLPEKFTESHYPDFWMRILMEEDLNYVSYKLLLSQYKTKHDDLPVEHMTEDQVAFLIKKKIISSSSKSYDFLNEHFPSLIIKFFETNDEEMIKMSESYELSSNDLSKILSSSVLTNERKINFVNHFEESIVLDNSDNILRIAQILVDSKLLNVSNGLLKNIILDDYINVDLRISLLPRIGIIEDHDFIFDMLKSFGEPYLNIVDDSMKAKLKGNDINTLLLINLVKSNYISSFTERSNGYLYVNHKKRK